MIRRAAVIGLLACVGCLHAARGVDSFTVHTVTVNGTTYPYSVFLPPGHDPAAGAKLPVILFLHGVGDRGNDGRRPARTGIGRAIRSDPGRFPFIVVLPQCPKDRFWTDDAMMAQALAALDQTVERLGGDSDRIYLTGLSMGGYGVWYFAARNPGRFAALVPISGGVGAPGADPPPGRFEEIARAVGSTPVWIFHGEDDSRVPVSGSRGMASALKAAGATVRYTEYEDVGHNAWDRAYAEPDLIPWLLAKKRGN